MMSQPPASNIFFAEVYLAGKLRCKLNDIDPFAYFNDVLRRVSTHPAEKIDDLLPGKWKPPLEKAGITEEDIAA